MMENISISAMLLLAKQSALDESTKKLLNDMINLIGNLITEVQRQQTEIDTLQKFAVDSGELLQHTNEGVTMIMNALQG